MDEDVEASLPKKPTIYIVDRNAGAKSGHHAQWFDRLTAALNVTDVHHQTVQPQPGDEKLSNREWYARAIDSALTSDASQLLFTAGDDVLFPALQHMWRFRSSGKPIHVFLFRMAKQPRRLGAMTLVLKIATLMLLKLGIKKSRFYVLQLPIGPRPRWHKWVGLVPVLDSSGLEIRPLCGKTSARNVYDGIAPTSHKILLVIGILGHGKHVDTLVEAWRGNEISNASLVFVGEAPADIHKLLLEASSAISSLSYVPGRATDEDFDRFVEGADAVVALYRYSASSGVVLKSLASGTNVLVGGSTVFNRQLKGVDGVILLDEVTVPAVSVSLVDVLSLPSVPAMEIDGLDSQFFPKPLVASIRSSEE